MSLISSILVVKVLYSSLAVMAHAIMFLLVPHAFPKELYEGTKMYGTFLSSQSKGKCITISSGSVSPAIMMTLAIPQLRALLDSFAPFLSCPFLAASAIRAWILIVKSLSARGVALLDVSSSILIIKTRAFLNLLSRLRNPVETLQGIFTSTHIHVSSWSIMLLS